MPKRRRLRKSQRGAPRPRLAQVLVLPCTDPRCLDHDGGQLLPPPSWVGWSQ